MNLTNPQYINIPKISDPRGNLSFIQTGLPVEMTVGDADWVYDVPSGASAVYHKPSDAPSLLVALTGSFVVNFDGHHGMLPLNRPDCGVFIPAGVGYSLTDFSTNAEALRVSGIVAASAPETSKDESEKTDPHLTSHVDDCQLLTLPTQPLRAGTCASSDLKGLCRVFYLYDVPCDAERGGHSHFDTCQLLVASAGSFDVELDDGHNKRTVRLNKPYQGLLIPPGIWRTMNNFSSGSVCLVMASEPYSEEDYVREYEDFLRRTSVKRV